MQETWTLVETITENFGPLSHSKKGSTQYLTTKSGFLKCGADKFGKQVPEFQRHMLLASSGLMTTRMCRACFVFVVNLIKNSDKTKPRHVQSLTAAKSSVRHNT